jgi:hypothetical protein
MLLQMWTRTWRRESSQAQALGKAMVPVFLLATVLMPLP